MAGVSLRAVAELLGHKGLRMVMRYAHLAPGYLSDEVRKLDTFRLVERRTERARKGQRAARGDQAAAKAPRFVRENGSSGRTRTYNPPVNRLMQVVFPVASSSVYLTLDASCSPVFGSKLFTDCSLSSVQAT